MRTTAISLALIAVALAAIVAGYASGQAGTHPPAVVILHPSASPWVRAVLRGASDAVVDDLFSNDEVVVDRANTRASSYAERLAIVIGLCGESAPLDGQFLALGLPLTLDLDPHGTDAERSARYAHESNALLLIHVASPPSASTLAALRRRFGSFDGIASRVSAGMPQALARTGLFFFDERGDALEAPFTAAGVRLLARDATVDNRASPAYIAFMLDRAAIRSRSQGPLAVLMRPVPDSLEALETFAQTRSAELVALTQTR